MIFSRFERLVAFRYLRSPRQEGFISIIAGFSFLGIALGVATLIVVMAVMNGFRQELLSRIVGLNGHLGVYGTQGKLVDYDALARRVASISGVVQAIPVIERQVIATRLNQARGVVIRGIREEDISKLPLVANTLTAGTVNGFSTAAGKERNSPPPHIAIGKRLAEKLLLAVGDYLTLISPDGHMTAFGVIPLEQSFKVVAIFEVGMAEYDKSVVFMNLPAAQQFFKLNGAVTNLEVFVKDPTHMAEQAGAIHKLVGDQAQVLDWQHSNAHLFHAVQVERNVMFLILTLIVLIAAFNIISGLTMLVKDKTRDIAIMRTMGATRATIMRTFFLTGATIGGVGTLLGVLLGLGFALNIERIRQWLEKFTEVDLFNAEVYFLSQLPAKIDWGEVTAVIIMALSLSFLATLYPAWRAARLDPVEGLR